MNLLTYLRGSRRCGTLARHKGFWNKKPFRDEEDL